MPWVEGTSPRYQPQTGSSSFAHREHPDVPWSFPGSDLTSVVLGEGGSVWGNAEASEPDAQGWQSVAVDPRVIAMRVGGLSQGFLVFDDTGSEWSRDGEKWTQRLFPNRFLHSRESGPANAPYFTFVLGAADRKAPAAVGPAEFVIDKLPQGEAIVRWKCPPDAVGFKARVDGKAVPQYLVPAARPGATIELNLRDLDLAADRVHRLRIVSVDATGNEDPRPAEQTFRVSAFVAKPFPERPKTPANAASPPGVFHPLVKRNAAGTLRIPAVVDGFDPVQPIARKEFLGLQVVHRSSTPQSVRLELPPGVDGAVFEQRDVPTAKGPLPDPLVPLANGTRVTPVGGNIRLHIDLYNRELRAPGKAAVVFADGHRVAFELRPWRFAIPDTLSFLPEMNCYSLPQNERAYYRLAHAHRTVLNRVPYGHSGKVDQGCAPARRPDGRFDWSAWDRRFAPLFDGSAFADLPRAGVPVEAFYLPLHENWPMPMAGNYNETYWAPDAFPPSYRAGFVEACRQFAEHLGGKKSGNSWDRTMFEFYLNNKNNYKARGWSRGVSPWLLDEPANWQDYVALRYYGRAFHEGVNQAFGSAGERPRPATLVFRGDISRPQWQRNDFDGLLDVNVVGGRAFEKYHRRVTRRQQQHGEIVQPYGSSNAIEASNLQPLGWCLYSWCRGGDGVIPWQTIGREQSWREADRLSLFYPGGPAGQDAPVPSIRLKAYRDGQQLTEMLHLYCSVTGEPRWSVGQQVLELLGLRAAHKGTGAAGEDAGVVRFDQLTPNQVTDLRLRLGHFLDARHLEVAKVPAAVWRPPARKVEPWTQKPGGRLVLAPSRDVLLDPERPSNKLGSEPRGNALRRTERGNAFLLGFDMEELEVKQVRKAELTVFMWDPHGKAETKVVPYGITTAWREADAAWGAGWRAADGAFSAADLGKSGAALQVPPNPAKDTVDPPVPLRFEVTGLVNAWLKGTPNHGLALVPMPDRAVDDGHHTRFQIYSREWRGAAARPRLVVEW